ncbi:MarR family transcriptional regulator [Pseudonocardia sp. TRM90224]|uniref:MarR family transcriptional regulator n=1 Tax=Pseudonocardia sp. TRM90224 TaxID=2812678 RepID=UPI001E3E3FE1|nr:MarR family transcriptional regulator [Pseudonocardia sp. TRM90224]
MHDGPDTTRTANLLGATALAVTDLAITGSARAVGLSTSAAAALVILSTAPGPSVSDLGRRIGLSQPAAARMVASMESTGLVRRAPGAGREVSVHPTPDGERTAAALLAARESALRRLVAALDPDAQQALAAALGTLLTELHGEVGSAELLCRMCDRACCVDGAVCPVGQAQRDSLRGS